MRTFATTDRSLAAHARLMAMVWVAQNDAGNACFESKYFYEWWRPSSAITQADTDGNDATTADPAWVPVVPTPNHPEYPAAHSCISGAMAGILDAYYGTPNITFDLVGAGPATGITRHYTSTTAMAEEIRVARIAGGMHFRTSTAAGEAIAATSRSGSSRTGSRHAEHKLIFALAVAKAAAFDDRSCIESRSNMLSLRAKQHGAVRQRVHWVTP